MAFAAIRYNIKDGCEDEIAGIFGGFRRVADPVVRDADGTPVGKVLATAVFIDGATMVRIIQYEGPLDDVVRFVAGQPGVQQVERDIVPYLASPRNTATPEEFVETFRSSMMRCLSQLPPAGAGSPPAAAPSGPPPGAA